MRWHVSHLPDPLVDRLLMREIVTLESITGENLEYFSYRRYNRLKEKTDNA